MVITKESIVASPAMQKPERKEVMSNEHEKYRTVLFIACTPNRYEESGNIKRC